jgi:hypothetical protein
MNSIGDRYACTDSTCGCEIEMRQPCRALDRDADPDLEASSSADDGTLETESELNTSSELETEVSLTCFCGNAMKQIMGTAEASATA